MRIFDFLVSQWSFSAELRKLGDVFIAGESQSSIEFRGEVTLEKIKKLLGIFRKYKLTFFVFDIYYPSLTEPGGKIFYSQEFNESENTWSLFSEIPVG